MAEHGAHLASSRFEDVNKPSIFEVLSQESLASTIHPALRHALRVFTEKYPEKLSKILYYFDEIYILFDGLVQFYYLRKYNSSFAENFYDLKRVPNGSISSTFLSRKLRFRVLACLILIPYIRHKLDTWFENLRYQMGSAAQTIWKQKNAKIKHRLLSLFVTVYPYVHSSWEFMNLAYRMNFMLRQGRYHSPSMHLSGTELVRVTEEDEEQGDLLGGSAWQHMSLREKLLRLSQLSLNYAAVGLSTGLSVGVFFLQFLEWWYASDASATSLTALPIPEPPQSKPMTDVPSNVCPICRRQRTNSTALAVSGYVFCYVCINEHVQRDKCCPVTGFPATSEHLVKIYEQVL